MRPDSRRTHAFRATEPLWPRRLAVARLDAMACAAVRHDRAPVQVVNGCTIGKQISMTRGACIPTRQHHGVRLFVVPVARSLPGHILANVVASQTLRSAEGCLTADHFCGWLRARAWAAPEILSHLATSDATHVDCRAALSPNGRLNPNLTLPLMLPPSTPAPPSSANALVTFGSG
jgi:hypothetical protein